MREYREELYAPQWLRWGLMGAMAMIGLSLAGAVLRGGPPPGTEWLFWLSLPVSTAAVIYAYANFTLLRIHVDEDALRFAYGIMRKTIPLSKIESVETRKYRWERYGGFGFSRGPHGRRAWSMPGVPEGVVVRLHESGKRREYFISSRHPLSLEAAIRSGRRLAAGELPAGDPGDG